MVIEKAYISQHYLGYMTQENYQSSNYQSSSSGSYQTSPIPVTETYQGSSNSVSDSYNSSNSSVTPVQMYAPSTETEILSEVKEVIEEFSQMYQSNEVVEEINTQTEDDSSVGYSGPQRPCCGRGCYDCVLFTR
jgi:hypothetical protein